MLMINLTLVIWNICQKQTNTENGIKNTIFITLVKSNIIKYFTINVNLILKCHKIKLIC